MSSLRVGGGEVVLGRLAGDEQAGGDLGVRQSAGGGPPRRGLILEILGAQGHEHYRVRWIDDHESIYSPADGAVIVRADHDVASR